MLDKKSIAIVLVLLVLVLFGCTGGKVVKDTNAPVVVPPTVDALPNITISNVDVNLISKVIEGQGYEALKYSLFGPIITFTSDKSKTFTYSELDSALVATYEIYDDSNKLLFSENEKSMYVKSGKTIWDLSEYKANLDNWPAVTKQGKYSILVKLSLGGKEIYSKTFNDILAGTTSYPVVKDVSMELSNVKYYQNIADYFDLTIKLTNKGNSELIGRYKIEVIKNGIPQSGDTYSGNEYTWSTGGSMGGYQYLTYLQPTGEKSTKTIDYSGVPLTCNAGDKSKLKISYIEMSQDKTDSVGEVLATAETQEFDCLNTI